MKNYMSGLSITFSLILILIGILIVKYSLKKDDATKILLLSFASSLFLMGMIGLTFSFSEHYYNMYSKTYDLTFGECLSTTSQIMSILGATSIGSIALYINRKSK